VEPPEPRPRRLALAWLLVPIGAFFVAAMVGTALSPTLLIESPAALIALNPVPRHLVLTVNLIDPATFYAIATLALFGPDPFHYLLGRLYGDQALIWVEKRSPATGRLVRGLERWFARAGLLILFAAPTGVVSLLAGAARVNAVAFVVINILGTLAMVTLVRLLGERFAAPIDAVIAFIQANVVALTIITVLLVAFGAWRRQRREGTAKS
jgi:membrane protein DedA with SNARE-associated domain